MKFTFFKRQRVLLPISKMENREFNALSRTELAKLQNFSLFFPGGRGPPRRNLNLDFSEKAKRDGTFYFQF